MNRPAQIETLGGLPARVPALITDPHTGKILGALTPLPDGGYWVTPAQFASFTAPTPSECAAKLDGTFREWSVKAPRVPHPDRWPGCKPHHVATLHAEKAQTRPQT